MDLGFWQHLAVAALVFVPLERLLALRKIRFFRDRLLLDLTHLFVNAILVGVAVGLVAIAAFSQSESLVPASWHAAIQAQPLWLQFLEVLLIADLGFYLAHRAFHRIPWLWRFHSVHHSIEHLDWIAAHRVHPMDQIVTKSASLLPVFLLGFDVAALAAFAILYQWQSLLIHANVRLDFGPARWILASPHFHHWHHANHSAAFDKNFAGQLPLWDLVFGSVYMPHGRMPDRYGTDDPVPTSYVGQLAHPFLPARKSADARTLEVSAALETSAD